MGKPIVREFTQGKGILKFFPYEGAACVVPQTAVTAADENGMKIVKAGTPYPSNDAGRCRCYSGRCTWNICIPGNYRLGKGKNTFTNYCRCS